MAQSIEEQEEKKYIKDMIDSGITPGGREYTETLDMYRYYNETLDKNNRIIFGLQEQLNTILIILAIILCVLISIG